MAAVNPANPQSWNLYAYSLNGPTSFLDPSGLDTTWNLSGMVCIPAPDIIVIVTASPDEKYPSLPLRPHQ
jgi:hypothetical protein